MIRRHHGRIHSLCLGLLGASHRADDAAQEIFVRAYKSLASFKRKSLFSTWLYRLANNYCLDLLRSQTRQKTDSWDALMEAQPNRAEALLAENTAPIRESDEILESAQEALQQMSPEYRLVLTLRELQAHTYEEIAEIMGVSIDSVKARLQRARRELVEKTRHFIGKQPSNP